MPEGFAGVVGMTEKKVKASRDADADMPVGLEPTQAEIDAWATQERQRRLAWLEGPSKEERAAYAQRLSHGRLADAFDASETRIEEGVRLGVRYGRESQLAAEGAVNLFYRWSRRTFGDLVRAGREWEEETSLPSRRRRVPLDDEDA
jgi:hypothetical protein